MVAAHHLIWTVYGWWLPNDPRGSTSTSIKSEVIAELGELHRGRKKLQPCREEIREFYSNARQVLRHELRSLREVEIGLVAAAFSNVIRDRHYTCYACAIMPDHVHIIIRKHRDRAEDMIGHLQATSRNVLLENGLFEGSHPVWSRGGGKVFLDSIADIERTIKYVEQNPVKIGRPVQRWPFVTVYDGWLPGIGPRR